MSVVAAHDLTLTRDCAVRGCTGEACDRNGLCWWHHQHGTPDQHGTPPEVRALRREVRRTGRQLKAALAEHTEALARLTAVTGNQP